MGKSTVALETGEGAEPGMRLQLPPAPVLLSFLLSVESACEPTSDGCGFEKAGSSLHGATVRSMRNATGTGRAPSGREPDEQRSGESPNALRELSFLLARRAAAHEHAQGETHAASNRVGRLRGFGNSIVPQVAAAFIRAVMS